MKTKTCAGLAPALALRRFATVAAVLLMLCLVFMMPVGATELDLSGTVVKVTAANAQDVLDGKYGTINGKTIHFTENIDTVLDLARPTKYQGSGTVYYKYNISIPGPEVNPTSWSKDISSSMNSHSHYYRTLKDVTFTADEGVTVAGFTFSAGHVASSGYDYVRDVELTSGVTYYKHSSLEGITFKDMTITGRFDAKLFLEGTHANDITFDNCVFEGTNGVSPAAIGFTADSIYHKNIVVKNCIFRNCYQGVYIQGVDGATITGNIISGTKHNAIALQSSTSNDAKGTITVTGNYIENSEDRAIRLNAVSAEAKISINNNIMVNSGESDGQLIKAETVADGAVINLDNNYWGGKSLLTVVAGLTAPTAVGITEGTWKMDVSKYVANGYYAQEKENGTYTVKNTCNVSFDSNGGSEVTAEQVSYTGTVTKPADPTKEGYTFAGWYLDDKLYDFTTLVTEDIKLTAKWNENPKTGEGVEVKPEISVDITVNQDGTTSIDTSSSGSTTVEVKENTVTITDVSTEVKMKVTFDGMLPPDEDRVSGKISSVEVTYPEKPAETIGQQEVTQQVIFDMNNVATDLPVIDSKKDETVVEIVKKQKQRANVLAMITAAHTNLDLINNNITEVRITFKVHASLISNSDFVKAYHVKGDAVDVLPEDKVKITGPEGGFYTITITSDKKFSSYVLAEEIPQTTSTGGSATDTGSGNYQYYPRSVPTDGIISFGTSKVVTGMELPAGSDGKVTLNIKPDFDMPENGYYAFEIDAPGYNPDAKINGGLSFQIPVSELERAGFTEKDIVLFHGTVAEDGKITWEQLPTYLNKVENGIAYYKAAINGCSPFYIGFVKDGAIINTEVLDPVTPETPVTPDEPEVLPPADEPQDEPTEEPATPAPILAVLAGLGAVIALRRK